jgi:hypothetical protein
VIHGPARDLIICKSKTDGFDQFIGVALETQVTFLLNVPPAPNKSDLTAKSLPMQHSCLNHTGGYMGLPNPMDKMRSQHFHTFVAHKNNVFMVVCEVGIELLRHIYDIETSFHKEFERYHQKGLIIIEGFFTI